MNTMQYREVFYEYLRFTLLELAIVLKHLEEKYGEDYSDPDLERVRPYMQWIYDSERRKLCFREN